MTVHRYHPILSTDVEKGIALGHVAEGFKGDPLEAVLYDDCDRCAEPASHPKASLDSRNLAILVNMAKSGAVPRTANERRAIRNLK